MSLPQIIRASQKRKVHFSEINWDEPIDQQKLWAPIPVTPLSHLPAFHQMSVPAKLRYNQYMALGLSEMFCLFEEFFLVKILQGLPVFANSDLTEALKHFVDDEMRHSELFRHLNFFARPDFYVDKKNFHFLKESSRQWSGMAFLSAFPQTLLTWVWMGIFFEERTLMYTKEYLKYHHDNPGVLDLHFVEAHRLHMIEEVRHVNMDSFLIDEIYAKAPVWKRKLAAFGMKRLMGYFASPRFLSRRILDRLSNEFPVEVPVFKQLRVELPMLADSESYHQILFSKDAIGRTSELMARFPEFDGIWDCVAADFPVQAYASY